MSSYRLPPIESVPKLSASEQAEILDHLFEPSPRLRTLCSSLLQERVFSAYDKLAMTIGDRLQDLLESGTTEDLQVLDEILGSHPRLGQKSIDSEQSQAEQAQLTSSDEKENKKLALMNDLYEETFPGLKFVTQVRGRPLSEILGEMQGRILHHERDFERLQAIRAMWRIAIERAHKLQGKHEGT